AFVEGIDRHEGLACRDLYFALRRFRHGKGAGVVDDFGEESMACRNRLTKDELAAKAEPIVLERLARKTEIIASAELTLGWLDRQVLDDDWRALDRFEGQFRVRLGAVQRQGPGAYQREPPS